MVIELSYNRIDFSHTQDNALHHDHDKRAECISTTQTNSSWTSWVHACKRPKRTNFKCSTDHRRMQRIQHAYSNVPWIGLYEILKEMEVPTNIIELVESLDKFNSIIVRTNGEESATSVAGRGVWQKCVLSSQLFNYTMRPWKLWNRNLTLEYTYASIWYIVMFFWP